MKGLFGLIEEYSKIFANKIAVVAGKEKLSYKELIERSIGFRNYLNKLGLKKGDKVILRANLTPYYWVALFGTILAGGIFMSIDKNLSIDATMDLIKEYDNTFLFIDDVEKITSFNTISFNKLKEYSTKFFDGVVIYEEPSEDELVQIVFTTGTTGKAKGVCWAYNYITNTPFVFPNLEYNESTSIIVLAPLNHTLANGRAGTTLCHGGTIIHVDGLYDIDDLYEKINEYNVNSFALTPSAINYLSKYTTDRFNEYKDNFRYFEIGGEKIQKKTQEDLIALLPNARLFIGYASTEGGPIGMYEFSKYGATDNRIGVISKGPEIKFFDEQGNIVNSSKEYPRYIGVKSNFKKLGYYNESELTKQLLKNDYYIMSDTGYIDDEGFLCFTGRAGDVIISGGYKINPTEVEGVALSGGLIKECVCYGVAHELFGKIVALDVVAEKEPLNKVAFKKYLIEKLEPSKIPKLINVVKEIKKNQVGKIDRKYYKAMGE